MTEQSYLRQRASSGLELTDEEALAAVAQSALTQSNSVPVKRPSDGDTEALEARLAHSGSPSDGDAVTRVDDVGQALSPDAQLLLDLIRTGGSWDAGTLCELTEMHPTRLAYALVDLELAHLVTRGMFGVFEAARGKSVGGRFKNAG